jgi:uncharacterized protein (DUF2267 family)
MQDQNTTAVPAAAPTVTTLQDRLNEKAKQKLDLELFNFFKDLWQHHFISNLPEVYVKEPGKDGQETYKATTISRLIKTESRYYEYSGSENFYGAFVQILQKKLLPEYIQAETDTLLSKIQDLERFMNNQESNQDY